MNLRGINKKSMVDEKGAKSPVLKRNISGWMLQAIKFGLVGVLNTGVDAGTYFMLTRWLGMGDVLVEAKALSFSAGVINSYFWNARWTFSESNRSRWQFGKFILVNITALIINAGIMQLGLITIAVGELLSFLMATAATFVWSFALSKLVVFRQGK